VRRQGRATHSPEQTRADALQVPISYADIDVPTQPVALSMQQQLTKTWARAVTQFIFLTTKYRIKFLLDKVCTRRKRYKGASPTRHPQRAQPNLRRYKVRAREWISSPIH
jgi:hypothetical protein